MQPAANPGGDRPRSVRRLTAVGRALVLGAACGCSTDSNPLEPLMTLAPITRQAAPVADEARVHRGEIVWADEAARFSPDLVDSAGSIKRAVYRSTSGVTGQPVEVAGVFAVPKGSAPAVAGGRSCHWHMARRGSNTAAGLHCNPISWDTSPPWPVC